MTTPAVSVVLPTYNRAVSLERCVASVLESLPSDGEIVICDDGSTDDTPRVLQSLATRDPRVRSVRGPHGGPAIARNLAWRAARAPVIAFIDDDCVAQKDWVSELLQALQDNPTWAAVEGKTAPANDDRGFFVHTIDSSAGAFLTCNLAVRRDALQRVGGFDEKFPFASCEDIDLCLRLQDQIGEVGYATAARVHHDCVPVGVQYYINRLKFDPSNYRLFARHPRRFHETVAKSRTTRLLSRLGEPTPPKILAYLISIRLTWALALLGRGQTLRERSSGAAVCFASAVLSLGQLPRGAREFNDAREPYS